MNENALSLILDNAKSLLESALILKNNNKLSHAGHFAAYSIEECSKYLMKTNSIKQFYVGKDLTNHFKKEDVILYFNAILGQLSVVYMLQFISNREADDEQWRSKCLDLSNSLLKDVVDLKSDASRNSMERIRNEADKHRIEKTYKYDKLRTKTVYTNQNTGKLEIFSRDEIYECLDFAFFYTEFLQMIHDGSFCWNRFFEISPSYIRNKFQSAADELLKSSKDTKA